MPTQFHNKTQLALAILLMILAFAQAALIGAWFVEHSLTSARDWGYLTGRVIIFVLLATAARWLYRRSRLPRDKS